MDGGRERQGNIPYQIERPQTQQPSRASFKSWLGSRHDWGSVILLFLVLEIAVRSIEQAQWITPQPSLTVVLALAVLAGWLLCKSRLPGAAVYPLVVVLGAVVTVWQSSNLLSSLETASKVNQLIVILQSWWQAASVAEPSEGTVHFAIFLIFFTWIVGYVSTWFVLRRHNAWVAVSLGAITILVNLSNLPEQYYGFFFFYLLAAILLVGQTSLARHRYWFKKHGINYPNRGMIFFMASVLCLSILTVSIAWLTPEIRVNRLETLISTSMPWRKNIEGHWINFFAAVPAKKPALRSSEQEVLFLGNSWRRSTEVHFVVSSKRPSYWRTRMYDIYTSWGWTNSLATERLLRQGVLWTEARTFSNRSELTYTVVTNLKTDILLTAGEFVSSDTPVLMQVGAGDIIAVIAPRLLKPNERYTVTASTSSATSADLSEAGENYPRWVTDHYLQLPPSLPERVRQLSESITEEAKSPHDKILAIKNYLSRFPYKLEIEAPPQGVDGVDYFLFSQKSGFCLYFASAMTVMLRSVDVPSRVAVGYLPGELDTETGNFIIRDKHYHAWMEVYFPGYGWVEFEATPGTGSEGDSLLVDDLEDEDEDLVGGNTDASGVGITLLNWWGLALLLFMFLMLAMGAAIHVRFQRFKELGDASEVYAKMCFFASLVKLGPKPQHTPLEYCAKLSSVFPLQAEAIGNITQTYQESRFGPGKLLGILPRPMGVLQKERLQQSWRDVSRVLLRRLFHVRR